ncbi:MULTISPECIES: sulfatase [Sphingobacterium]|uniref:sulfatase n=1 Tax=Sphingobacterium TaxID=28453 RepID=UPI001046B9B0|nr:MULTISPECIES: sulfatase [Sphingobacterium]MCW2262323.1 arylsulfatase A-like enzyme [Sphingobacterium kitahiroshimense]TCR12929.1 arylsulfatase A-like enzyme [Sphingobacterium sp. JUb78]
MLFKKSTFFLLLFSCALGSGEVHAQTKERPNIIVFIVDDMGWEDTSVPFWKEKTPLNNFYQTPNMERLANQGMKFTQAYASSVCSPSRVSLMSGMNAARHRVTNWTLNRNASVDAKDDELDFPLWNVNGMQPVDTIERSVFVNSLPQLLKENGYLTVHAGKAHFGAVGTPGADPINLGFDVNIAGHAAGGPGSFLGTENFGNNKDGTPKSPWGVPGLEEYYGQDIFLTEALTQKALKVLNDSLSNQKPFFLYMSHYAVHVPFNADKRFYQKYIDKGATHVEAQYASMVEGMDKSLGDMMDFLESKHLTDNTIILFISDNGGYAIQDRGRTCKKHRWNEPLKSGKGSAYEGGIRVPMLVKWPAVVKENSVTEYPVIIEDIFPTVLNMAGVKKTKTVQHIDGENFISVLKANKQVNRKSAIYWHFPNSWGETGPGIGATSTVRDGDWKLIYWHKTQKKELFNIKNDIGEEQDLAMNNPKIVKRLSHKLGGYLRHVDAQMPIIKNTKASVPYPDVVSDR